MINKRDVKFIFYDHLGEQLFMTNPSILKLNCVFLILFYRTSRLDLNFRGGAAPLLIRMSIIEMILVL